MIEPQRTGSDQRYIAETRANYYSSGKPSDSNRGNVPGIADDDGPTDMAENHDKYLPEAYVDTHEDDDTPFTNPDGDTTLTPREWLLKNDPLFWTLPGGAHKGEPEYIERC